MGEQDPLHGFFQAGDVGDEPVADGRELEVGDEGVAVVITGKRRGVEHFGPEFPGLLGGGAGGEGSDGVHVVFDGGSLGSCLGAGWEGDLVGGLDGAAAVDEFSVDRAGLRGGDGQGEFVAWFAVVRGEGVVADEESVADGDALFGEDAGECRDGAGVGFGLSGLAGFAGVDGEE